MFDSNTNQIKWTVDNLLDYADIEPGDVLYCVLFSQRAYAAGTTISPGFDGIIAKKRQKFEDIT